MSYPSHHIPSHDFQSQWDTFWMLLQARILHLATRK